MAGSIRKPTRGCPARAYDAPRMKALSDQVVAMFLAGGWVAVALVTIITPFLVPLGFPSREVTPARMTRWIILLVSTLLLLLVIGFLFFLSMWLPMQSLITNISRR